MGLIYDVFDKFSIVGIVIGLILGIYLAIHHNESNLWISSIPFILIFSILITIFPIGAAIQDKSKNGTPIPINALVEAFILNIAVFAVCTAFGVVIGSFIIGNVIMDNGKLPFFN